MNEDAALTKPDRILSGIAVFMYGVFGFIALGLFALVVYFVFSGRGNPAWWEVCFYLLYFVFFITVIIRQWRKRFSPWLFCQVVIIFLFPYSMLALMKFTGARSGGKIYGGALDFFLVLNAVLVLALVVINLVYANKGKEQAASAERIQGS